MKGKIGCGLNITEDLTIIAQVRIKSGRAQMSNRGSWGFLLIYLGCRLRRHVWCVSLAHLPRLPTAAPCVVWYTRQRRYSSTAFNLGFNGSEWSASRLGRFIPRGQNPLYALVRRLSRCHSRSGCSGVQTSQQVVGKYKLHLCLRNYSDLKKRLHATKFSETWICYRRCVFT